MDPLAIQRVRSKWAKTKVLLRSAEMHSYIPQTKRFSRETLHRMLQEYEMVYVKPVSGTYGNGVIRVERTGEQGSGYRFQHGTTVRSAAIFDALFEALSAYVSRKGYIVQKGIHLLKHRGRRFDLRVMVQKNLRNQWETTGIIGKLGNPRKIVTNYNNGGTIWSFETLLSSHLSASEMSALHAKLKRLGVKIGSQLQTAYPGLKELGVDVAIDTKFHPWVLEVNTKPHPYIFNKLADKSMHRKVTRYAAAYGGIKRKKH
ncbi:endospore coat-associated protein [Paenibacillus agaridevorans]|uniref:Endospore coat-associated protein n=1 Tax=Paenibacillus agaridevorans TaxID=171404 RepID=A0A2R5ELG0_9BACL|nr:YheC/YheD family protein [Paenibacillus agaridevorans]GBG06935.1 endospore coat-associated protein [Paenibacillus agaridevorans]